MKTDGVWRETLHSIKHQSKDHYLLSQVPAHAKQELSAEIMTSALVCGIIRIYKCPGISIRIKTLEAKLYEKVELIRESSDSGLVEGTCRVSEPPTRLVSSD